MPIVHPSTYQRRIPKRKRSRWPYYVLLVIVLAGLVNYWRPLPSATASITVPGLNQSGEVTLAWPSFGQAAIGAPGYGVLMSHGQQTPMSTASIAKVIVALCVLEKYPLQIGQNGPIYTIGNDDLAILQNYVNNDGSAINVVVGEQLSEYQALEALLIPSANNIADSLVKWVFGSQSNYASYATNYLNRNGLTHTHIGSDASGFDPSTTSTASDLTELGLLALKSPVIMQIAQQTNVALPVVGTVSNYNTVLGQDGITGLKTGNNLADPGAFLFTAKVRLGGKDVETTGAVMGAPDLDSALRASTQLAASAAKGFSQVSVVTAHQTLGSLHTAWGVRSDIVTAQTAQLVHWKPAKLYETHQLDPSVRSGTIGQLHIRSGPAEAGTNLVLSHKVPEPSFWWRLTRH